MGRDHDASEDGGAEAREPDDEENGRDEEDEADVLVCMTDNVEVDGDDPRCLHPSSQCRFREHCVVMKRVRERRKRTPLAGERG